MWGIAALVSTLLVTLSIAALIGRSDIGSGMVAATVQVSRVTAYWPAAATYPSEAESAALEAERVAQETPRRWAWSADNLPPAPKLPPGLLTPNLPLSPALLAPPRQPGSNGSGWQVSDAGQVWHA